MKMYRKGVFPIVLLAFLIVGIVFIGLSIYAYSQISDASEVSQGSSVQQPPVSNDRVEVLPSPQPPQVDCPSGFSKNSAGLCVQDSFNVPAPSGGSCEPKAVIKSAYVRTKVNAGDVTKNALGTYPATITIQYQVSSDCEANYYFEAGLQKTGALTVLQPAGSACDGNLHYAGKMIKMSKNTRIGSGAAGMVDIAFFPQDYGKTEQLKAVGGVYSGCFKDGGKTIAEIPSVIVQARNPLTSTPFTSTEITGSGKKIV